MTEYFKSKSQIVYIDYYDATKLFNKKQKNSTRTIEGEACSGLLSLKKCFICGEIEADYKRFSINSVEKDTDIPTWSLIVYPCSKNGARSISSKYITNMIDLPTTYKGGWSWGDYVLVPYKFKDRKIVFIKEDKNIIDIDDLSPVCYITAGKGGNWLGMPIGIDGQYVYNWRQLKDAIITDFSHKSCRIEHSEHEPILRVIEKALHFKEGILQGTEDDINIINEHKPKTFLRKTMWLKRFLIENWASIIKALPLIDAQKEDKNESGQY